MKCLQKQTNCAVFADFRDAAFAQTDPNSRFLRDFFAQNGAYVQGFVRFIYFLEGLTRNFEPRNLFFEPRNSFFGAWNLFFGARTKKSCYRNLFAAAPGPFFFPVGTFFPDTFPVSFCRRNPPTGFPASRTSAPGASRVPSKGQVLRGFHDILIPAWRVWLRFLRAVPTRRPNTRFSEGENEQIVNGPRMCSFCQWKDGHRGAHSLSRRYPDNAPRGTSLLLRTLARCPCGNHNAWRYGHSTILHRTSSCTMRRIFCGLPLTYSFLFRT